MSALIEELCPAVPVLLGIYRSSWRGNSCDSDPGGGERSHQNTARLRRWKRKPWDITVRCRWRQRQTKLTSLAGILTLYPINAALITTFWGLKEVVEFVYSTVTGESRERDSWDILPQRFCPFMFKWLDDISLLLPDITAEMNEGCHSNHVYS